MPGWKDLYDFITERKVSLFECLLCLGLLGYTMYIWFSIKIKSLKVKQDDLKEIKADFEVKVHQTLNDLRTINEKIANIECKLKEQQLNCDGLKVDSSFQQTNINEAVYKKLIDLKIIDDDSWLTFKTLFKSIFPEYFNYIVKELSYDLTEGEIRMIMLLKLNYNYKEMSDCLGISNESARIALYRLKKKLRFTGSAAELNLMLLESFKNSRTG